MLPNDPAGLQALWKDRDPAAWDADRYRAVAQALLNLGSPMLGLEVATEGLDRWPRDPALSRSQALALARTGGSERASLILQTLVEEGHGTEETRGLLARTYKDMALASRDPAQRTRLLRLSHDVYAAAFRLNPRSYWTGINAATLALLLRDDATAERTAKLVADLCRAQLETAADSERFWLTATLGEAELVQRHRDDAADLYRKAHALAPRRFGDHSSTRRQARLILAHLGEDPELATAWLPKPRVIVFSGHMLDRPDRPKPRFPAAQEPAVRDALNERLTRLDAQVGFASAAAGGDLLFLEALLERRGEVHVVLPFEREEFLRESVDPAGGDWRGRFDAVLARASSVTYTSREKMAAGGVSYDYANLVLQGLAQVRAQELDTALTGLALWDGKPGDGSGGTASAVDRWLRSGLALEVVDPLAPALLPPARKPARRKAPKVEKGHTHVMAMLFADAVHFSKLKEAQVPVFVREFLGAIARVLKRYPSAVVKNTWGDGLYVVFKSIKDAGLFALDMAELITATRWSRFGLPSTLNARIALHAGPVYRCRDPIIGQISYIGTHVSRTARIEPITPPGQVYASQAFAALAAVEGVAEFRCEYVRQAELAKNYGSFPTYLVRREARARRKR